MDSGEKTYKESVRSILGYIYIKKKNVKKLSNIIFKLSL